MTTTRPRAAMVRIRRPELLLLLAILALAALTRLPGIADRGRWDADQGHDMLELRALVVDGTVPLLGPRTSIGTFHHGAVYYYLLAPAAAVSAADPVAVTVEIALFGIAAVAGAWWLARLIGGPIAGAAAGLLAAVSPAGIDESTFIWNPNLIPAAAALAFGAALMARRTGHARWWVACGLGAMITMQCHVLGVVILLPLAWAWGVDVVRRRGAGHPARGAWLGGLGALLVVAAGFLPLLVHELTHDFAETRGIIEYLVAGGRVSGGAGVLESILLVGLRSITWPLTGLITDRATVSLVVAVIVVLLGTVAVLGQRRGDPGGLPVVRAAGLPAGGRAPDLPAARWLLAGLGTSVVLLAVFAPSLAVIVPELPNDHYHAFLDPIVLALVGIGIARLWTVDAARTAAAARIAAGAIVAVLVGIAVTAWPPAQAPDGGWPLADEAAARVLASTDDTPVLLDGIPAFKSADALRFPLERRGAPVLAEDAVEPEPGVATVVLVCDPLFDEVVGAACGGPAEDAWMAAEPERAGWGLVERFDAGSRRVISVYALGTVPDSEP
ncbi:MAG TPA: glycosyltransferase family 39 protein [Candidatus Limnocylindrales bacterium]|nr:glycosyltransferase family 39 protein [Candidatus Limnocylindrales bacterium]